MDSDSNTGNSFEFVVSFSIGGDKIIWCEQDVIDGYEKEVMEIHDGVPVEKQKESAMRLAWALVHSRQAEDIHRGIDMLDVSTKRWSPHVDEIQNFYLLAVGYYRIGDYLKSKKHVEWCIKLQPDYRQALVLKKTIEDTLLKDGIIAMIILGSALGLVVSGITAALARKK